MEFQEVKNILRGYNEYFYTMLSCNIKLIYKKQYKEFVFQKLETSNDASRTLIAFEVGNINNIKVRILNYKDVSYYFEDRYKGGIFLNELFDEAIIQIDSTKRLHYLFSILEEINFFNSRRWL